MCIIAGHFCRGMPRKRRKAGKPPPAASPETKSDAVQRTVEVQATNPQQMQEHWREWMRSFFPQICQTTYFVPPLYFNRVAYEQHETAGTQVLVQRQASKECEPRSVSVCDEREDNAQRRVIYCFEKLLEKRQEVVFVISQLNFANYLNKMSNSTLLTPKTMEKKEYRSGDFDLIIVIKGRGIILGEIKSVGLYGDDKIIEESIVKRVGKAVEQLVKSEEVMTTLMTDVHATLPMAKVLILPYVSSDRLQRAVTRGHLQEKVCECIETARLEDAIKLCLCCDSMFDRDSTKEVTASRLSELQAWLERQLTLLPSHSMTDAQYESIVTRLAGTATTVAVHCPSSPRLEVRTLGEAVSEAGERLSKIVLTLDQLNLLNKAHEMPMVCLVGPPGTGKSQMLVLVGLTWLRDGHDVIVLGTRVETVAISLQIKQQLEKTFRPDTTAPQHTPKVTYLYYNLRCEKEGSKNADEAVKTILTKVKDGALFILMDEVWFTSKFAGRLLTQIIVELKGRVPKLHLWAGTLRHIDIPGCLPTKPLTVPLRCAPVIQQEVDRGLDTRIEKYTSNGIPAPCDGSKVITLLHEGGDHTGQWPVQCYTCGTMVAEELRKLNVDVQGNTASSVSSIDQDTQRPPPLKFSDVFVLTRSSELQDDENHDTSSDGMQASNDVTPSVCGFVRGLRHYKIPVRVISADIADFEGTTRDLVLSDKDHVIVTDVDVVHGLERKVVVFLKGKKRGDNLNEADLESTGRQYAFSRCQSQLIVVDVPSSS